MCRERKPAVWVWGDTNRRGTSAGLNWCSNTCFWSKYCELLFFTKKLKHCWSTVVIQEVRVHTSNWDLTFARSLSKGETRCHGNQSVTFRSFISQPSGPSLKASASISINPKPHSESKKMRNACVKVRCQWKCRWDSTLCWLAKCSASLDFILKILHTYLKTSTASSQSQTGMCQPSENTQPDPSLFRRELERIHLKQLLEPSGLCADVCVCVCVVSVATVLQNERHHPPRPLHNPPALPHHSSRGVSSLQAGKGGWRNVSLRHKYLSPQQKNKPCPKIGESSQLVPKIVWLQGWQCRLVCWPHTHTHTHTLSGDPQQHVVQISTIMVSRKGILMTFEL